MLNPTVSFVVSNHDMSEQTKRIVDHLRKFSGNEIIVLDDGSSHDHTKALLDHMNGVNEFIVHANDLFDVVMLNRVFGFARGKYIVALQDDDIHKGREWVTEALRILNGDPKIAVLGGRHLISVSGNGGVSVEGMGPFRYAQAVNTAPMWVRKDAFLELGGFDNNFVPMMWHESDLCIRAWLNGYRVGWYSSGVDSCGVPTPKRRAGKAIFEAEARRKNRALLMEKHGAVLDDVQKMVEACNKQKGTG